MLHIAAKRPPWDSVAAPRGRSYLDTADDGSCLMSGLSRVRPQLGLRPSVVLEGGIMSACIQPFATQPSEGMKRVRLVWGEC